MKPERVMIVAGEASGDLHGAGLVRAMRARRPDLRFFGIGGTAMREAGVEIVVDSGRLSVVGITEVFVKIPDLLSGYAAARRAIRRRRPDLLILIDFPDFNLRLAGVAKAAGIPVLYYISPQIWAWRSGRVKKIGRLVDHMAVILPFEAGFYLEHSIPATYVGHPLLDTGAYRGPCREAACSPGAPVVGLLPGSRDREVARHVPVMLEAAALLRKRIPGIRFMVSVAPGLSVSRVKHFAGPAASAGHVSWVDGGVEPLFSTCDMVVAASGTVSLEAALACVPMAVIYRVSPASYWLGRALIRVSFISLVNLIAGEAVVPELIQKDASPARIAETVGGMLTTPGALERVRDRLKEVKAALGSPGASRRTADIALELMEARRGGAGEGRTGR